MPDKRTRIWMVAFFESHLTSPSIPERIHAIPHAFFNGFDVDEIVALTEFPKWRVQQVLLADAVNRATDD
jgi:hypothetical protein